MPTDTETAATPPAPERAETAGASAITASRGDRLPFPLRTRRFPAALPKGLRRPIRALDRDFIRLVEYFGAPPSRRRRAALFGAVMFNAALLTVLAVYGRVRIYVPNKPADSISIVYVDVSAELPVIDLRDPEIAPEPEPEPVAEPEITPKPEPAPVPEPKPSEAPTPRPEPEPEPERKPVIDFTPEPVFAPPSEFDEAPLIPEESPAATPTTVEASPGDILVEGEQAPAEEAPPLVSVEPEARQAEAEEDAGEEEEAGAVGAGELAAGEQEASERDAVATSSPVRPEETKKPLAGDDAFDEEPVFGGRLLALPPVDLPKGEASTVPGTSGVVAIFCPDEFTDKEKIAECAGRPEIRSGWRPGASGEDFSKAAAVLKNRREHGDFSNDTVTFGPEIARQIEERRKIEALGEFRNRQDAGSVGLANDPAAGTRPSLTPPIADPSWTRREDPLVGHKDVEKLRKDLEAAEKARNVPEE